MLARYIVDGVLGLDGTYEIDLETLTANELHQVKRMSGVRANEFDEAMIAGDAALHVAVTLCAIRRSGDSRASLPGAEDALMDAPINSIRLELVDSEAKDGDDTDPPETQPE